MLFVVAKPFATENARNGSLDSVAFAEVKQWFAPQPVIGHPLTSMRPELEM